LTDPDRGFAGVRRERVAFGQDVELEFGTARVNVDIGGFVEADDAASTGTQQHPSHLGAEGHPVTDADRVLVHRPQLTAPRPRRARSAPIPLPADGHVPVAGPATLRRLQCGPSVPADSGG
jgi:hypothetical protein